MPESTLKARTRTLFSPPIVNDKIIDGNNSGRFSGKAAVKYDYIILWRCS